MSNYDSRRTFAAKISTFIQNYSVGKIDLLSLRQAEIFLEKHCGFEQDSSEVKEFKQYFEKLSSEFCKSNFKNCKNEFCEYNNFPSCDIVNSMIGYMHRRFGEDSGINYLTANFPKPKEICITEDQIRMGLEDRIRFQCADAHRVLKEGGFFDNVLRKKKTPEPQT